jgi:hypothetical protein
MTSKLRTAYWRFDAYVKFYLKAKTGHAMSFRQQRKRNKEKRKQEKN